MCAQLNVLLVEDDSVDAEVFIRGLRQQPEPLLVLTVVNNGEGALHLLRQQHESLYPCIILLDLRLPGMDGLTFLRELRHDPLLKNSIVFLISGSTSEPDIAEAYRLGIAGYIHKRDTDSLSAQALVNLLIAYATTVHFPEKT